MLDLPSPWGKAGQGCQQYREWAQLLLWGFVPAARRLHQWISQAC
jgi:hypothetical protein